MRVLILSTAFSGMAQRVLTELKSMNHTVDEHYDLEEDFLIEQVDRFQPDVIICPFLTQRIPEVVWKNYICLIVHPGIEGDRGPSSLDWAISEGVDEWGVTLLQADEQYDAGDIWGTRRFPMRNASKTSIYKREVTEATIELVKQVLNDIERNNFTPRSLDYDSPLVKGRRRPLMKQSDRVIDWHKMGTKDVVQKLNAADSRPGVKGCINGVEVNMYGAVSEPNLKGAPGDILAIHKGAFCCATRDGAVWIKQLKCVGQEELAPIKLPASMVLEKIGNSSQLQSMPHIEDTHAIEEIRVETTADTAYIYFDFYNGAMNTQQCLDLKNVIARVKTTPIKTIVLMGGEDFFSNGIHLNCIEASDNPAMESWDNINAIDDLVMEIMDSPNHITISAMRNNAGAGGVILGLACDEVIIRKGVVLNPHYKSMGLYGSEYWTYLLPRRVGEQKAIEITEGCMPMLSDEAVELGLADLIFDENWESYHEHLSEYCLHLQHVVNIDEFLSAKRSKFEKQNAVQPFSEIRKAELAIMKKTFFDPASSYHAKRRAFVYKQKAKIERTPRWERVAQKA